MSTIDKVPSTLAGVEAYARARGVKFGFSRDAFEATHVIDDPFDRFLQAEFMVATMRDLGNNADGTSNRHLRIVVVVSKDGWTDVAYAVALHELGHVFSPKQSGRGDENIADEIDAWAWARAHAEYWTEKMSRDERFALASYRAAAPDQRPKFDDVQ